MAPNHRAFSSRIEINSLERALFSITASLLARNTVILCNEIYSRPSSVSLCCHGDAKLLAPQEVETCGRSRVRISGLGFLQSLQRLGSTCASSARFGGQDCWFVLGGPGSRSLPGNRLSCLGVFVGFLSLLKQIMSRTLSSTYFSTQHYIPCNTAT